MRALLLSLLLSFICVSLAHADIAPPNSQYVSHTQYVKGTKAFPKHRFYVFIWRGNATQVVEGKKLGSLKFGSKLYAVSPKQMKLLKGKKLTRKLFRTHKIAATKKRLYTNYFLKKPTKVRSLKTVWTVKKVDARQVTLETVVTAYDAKGKQLWSKGGKKAKTKASKSVKSGKKYASLGRKRAKCGTAMVMNRRREEQKRTWWAALPLGVAVVGIFLLAWGVRRRRAL